MEREEAQRYRMIRPGPETPRRKTNTWNKVFNERKRRVRGLWERNGIYYAQLTVDGKPVRFRLEHATTVSQAITEQQVLKGKQRNGELKRPLDAPAPEPVKPGAKTLDQAIELYREDRDDLKKKNPKTGERENSGLNALSEFGGRRALDTIDDKYSDRLRQMAAEPGKARKTGAKGHAR